MKLHDEWNEIKKSTEQINDKLYFKERDIFWARLGQNIGFEQNGKGEEFTRPVVILKKYTKDMFLAIPLSTTSRDGTFFYQFSFLPNEISTALLVQNRHLSTKRLVKKLGKISEKDFQELKEKFKKLVD